LIPRPETEHLIEAVLQLQTSALAPQNSGSTVRIADVGTGSGCIALALAKELPNAEIYATDISAAALEIARANAARHQLQTRIQFRQTDLLADLEPPFDLIVSNPPYVGESEEVQLEVRKFEPRSAVFGGPTGTEVIARLIPQARRLLRPGGSLVLEVSGSIADQVVRLLTGWDQPDVILDLQQIPRVMRARRP
jgi:release factor glutamine methyltransferase